MRTSKASTAPPACRSSTASCRVSFRGVGGRAAERGRPRAEAGGFTITDLSVTEPTLEAVFINLTGKDLRE